MKVKAIRTRLFKPGEKLSDFLDQYFRRPAEGDILIITSKIVALAEKRFVTGATEAGKRRIIRRESDLVIPTRYVYLTLKDGMIMANAGADESNADGALILLPRDSFRTAAAIRAQFRKRFGLRKLGVIITDSRCLPRRAGTVGVALGYAGFRGLKDYRRCRDLFGRPFRYSRIDIADSLATAAVLLMGEGDERQPLALISGAPVEYAERVSRNELKISGRDDLYGSLGHFDKRHP